MSFAALGLSGPLLQRTNELGYVKPTPIQHKAIPVALSGRDMLAIAQTGTGKTASFVLPLLQRLALGPKVKANHVRALILTPTRELAVQVAESVHSYGQHLALKSTVVYGGVKINPQMMKMRSGTDILIATPGRLLDLFKQNAVKFYQVETLVLDEADLMLSMGFSEEISNILKLLPQKRQNLLFSATFSTEIQSISERLLKNPVKITIDPAETLTKCVRHLIYEVDKEMKFAILRFLILKNNWERVLIFTRTRDNADRLVKKMIKNGLSAATIHANNSQAARLKALQDFKAARIKILVATDIAARGIDISGLPQVINFDLPQVAENYIHRIGRTGRADTPGEAISLVSADEFKLLERIEIRLGQNLMRKIEPDFKPKQKVPLSRKIKAVQKN